MVGQNDPSCVRVSDAERADAVQRLNRALGEGRLNLAEFTERTDRALACRTRGELDALFADLPALSASQDPVEPVLQLRPRNSTLQRQGTWVVPAEITINGKSGAVLLDFRHAHWSVPQVEITVSTKYTKVEFVVSQDTWVDCNGLELVHGSVQNRRGGPETPSALHRIVVRGKMQYANLVVRRPSDKSSWWQRLGLPPLR